jgi:hypothetical protein
MSGVTGISCIKYKICTTYRREQTEVTHISAFADAIVYSYFSHWNVAEAERKNFGEIWCFNGVGYEDVSLLECDAV